MEKKSILASLFIIISLFLVSCTKTEIMQQVQQNPKKQCMQDFECVPATCCHPKDALNIKYAPNCAEMVCTMECRPGTIDCGQGEIKCVKNQCTTIIH